GVAGHQHTAPLKALRHQRKPCRPSRAPKHLDRTGSTDRLREHRVRPAVADLALLLAGPELSVEHEVTPPVDRGHEAAPVAIEGPVHPGLAMRDAEVQHVHLPAHEVALCAAFAYVAVAKRAPHGASRAISADSFATMTAATPHTTAT